MSALLTTCLLFSLFNTVLEVLARAVKTSERNEKHPDWKGRSKKKKSVAAKWLRVVGDTEVQGFNFLTGFYFPVNKRNCCKLKSAFMDNGRELSKVITLSHMMEQAL